MRSRFITGPQDSSGAFPDRAAAEFYTSNSPVRDGIPPAGAPALTPALTSEAVESLAAQSGPTSTVSMVAGGITINLLFDAAAMAAPASFRAGIQEAASLLTAAISDPITINIKIDYNGTGGGAAAGPDNGLFVSYSSVKANLINNATAGDTTFNALPAGSSIQGQTNLAVWNAQLKLWGILGANDTTTDDGSATFATDINPSLLVGVALHELTHAMGRVPYGPAPDVLDLFRFTSPGVHLFSGADTAPAAYFALDGGNTKLADYGRTSDPSDFLNSGVQGSNDPFNEFYNGGTIQSLSATDKAQLDALGFHVWAANHAPVVTLPTANVMTTAGQILAATNLFGATDPDNDNLSYFFFDNTAAANSGHFLVNGTQVPAGGAYAATGAQLAQTTFVAAAPGISDDLFVEAFDGHAYSGWSEFHVNSASNTAPVMSIASASVTASDGQTLAASNLFSATDAEHDALSYFLFDNTPTANSGHFSVNGAQVPAGAAYGVTTAQLAQTTFVAGASGTSDDLFVEAFDGHAYSGWSEFNVNTPSMSNTAPVVSLPSTNVIATGGQTLAASSLFSATDADQDALSYFVFDNTPAANSGHFSVNGTQVPVGAAYGVTAAQLAQTTFVVGAPGTADDLFVEAFDGHAYSGWSEFHVNTAPSSPPVVFIASTNLTATPGQTFAASSLFSATDAQNDQLTYYVFDNTPAANSGHFAVNGMAVPASSVYQVSAAQLAQTTFTSGAVGTLDDLFVDAFDGHTHSGWSEFHVLV